MESYIKVFTPLVDALDIEIIQVKKISNDLLEIIIAYKDRTEAIDLETSAKVAQVLAEAIDYEIGLDVSSQGAERMIQPQDYESVLNQYVFVKFKDPKQGMDQVSGELSAVHDTSITIKYRFKHTYKTVDVERENIELLRTAVKI